MPRRALVACLLATAGCAADPATPLPEVDDPVPLTDPTIGTGGVGFAYGSAFVGAAVPHGLVKVGPDTSGEFGTIGFQHFSGYFAGDDRIQGFSTLHLHGAGLSDYGVLSVMPALAFAPAQTSVVDHQARFAKADEHARVGHYAVTLDSGIGVELTATSHGAHHRYTFPAGADSGVLVIDLAKVLDDGEISSAEVHLDAAAQTIRGQLHHGGQMSGNYGGYDLYFAMRTSVPWQGAQVWSGGGAAADGSDAAGTGVGAMLRVGADAPVELILAVSLVSAEGALANLDAELPGFDFDAVRAAAEDAWRERLEVVALTGGTEAQRRIFYASLYHAFLMPTVIGDADGAYRLAGVDAPRLADGWTQLSDASLWDTYRTVHPLYGWLAPDSARDAAQSLVAMGEGLGAFPTWPIAIGESGTMLGASAEIVIADAMARGVEGVDYAGAYPRLRAAAMEVPGPAAGRGGRGDVEAYMQYGYVPASGGSTVSLTTEYAHDDFALGQLAAALGESDDAATLDQRRTGWRALYDPEVGFLTGRGADGSFANDDFDPLEMHDDYAEANAWHSLWMAGAHDIEGLIELHGGVDGLIGKLEAFFDATEADWALGDPAAASFPRPYYWHGNEPDLDAAFLFAQAGRPALTQRWVRWILDHLYADTPAGLAGNDDGGTLGAWYVFASLGLYPVPGSDRYVLGAPLFPQARVRVGGRELVIVGEGVSERNLYVQAATLDGVAVERAELRHAELIGASELRFVMGPMPSEWGRR